MYITTEQLINLFGEQELIQRTDSLPYTGAINQTVLDEAINLAERKIDGYLRSAYTLPLSAELIASSSLPETCGDIVRYALYHDMATDEVIRRYKDALAWLKDVQAGRVTLGAVDNTVAPTGNVIVVQGVSGIKWDSY
jgi:phage gp36-like protein